MSLVLPEHAVHGNDARAEPAYSLKFYQLCVKVDRLYTHQLQVLIHDRRPQLVRRKFEAEEERRARFWRHAGETMLGRDEEPKASEELREREERSSELSLSSSMSKRNLSDSDCQTPERPRTPAGRTGPMRFTQFLKLSCSELVASYLLQTYSYAIYPNPELMLKAALMLRST